MYRVWISRHEQRKMSGLQVRKWASQAHYDENGLKWCWKRMSAPRAAQMLEELGYVYDIERIERTV